jgi:4-amino-4-deoxy-L-arabinose transferase-like glycosyltransferase
MKMTDLQRKKLSSRRFLTVIWACLVLTSWGTLSLIANVTHPWMSVVMPIIAGIPVSYVTITSLKKKKEGEE